MKLSYYLIFCLYLFPVATRAQNYKFDFGTGKVAPGYIQITPHTMFSNITGHGFERGSLVESVDHGGNPLTGDFITSDKPFFFSVKLAEGNYDVRVILGDTKGTSATTIRTECRRLMGANIRTAKGRVIAQTFTIHVKDSLIRDDKGNISDRVKLKPREFSYLHWDNLLTIEFNDSLPKVCALEITRNSTAATIFLAGNSTVVDQDREPWAAWGQMFPSFFDAKNICIANYAESGETLKAFSAEKKTAKNMGDGKARRLSVYRIYPQ